MKMSQKIKTSISLFAFAGILLSSMSFALSQVSNGAMYGYTATPGATETLSDRVYRVRLTDGVYEERCPTNMDGSIEGMFSIDEFSVFGGSNLFGVTPTPNDTSQGFDIPYLPLVGQTE
jgi:hypothetical protein